MHKSKPIAPRPSGCDANCTSGHLGRKGDGPPGTQVLWRGLQRLDTATEMYVIFTQDDPHPQKSGP
jgi:hypothetical protein